MEIQIENAPAIPKRRDLFMSSALIGERTAKQFRPFVRFAARGVWLAVMLVTVAIFVLSLDSRASQSIVLAQENQIALSALGFPRGWMPPYLTAWDIVTMLVYTIVSVLIYRYKSNEWIAWFASLTLVTMGLVLVRPTSALQFLDEWLRLPSLFIFTTGTITMTIFTFIFPDGRFKPRWARWVVLPFVLFFLWAYLRLPFQKPLTWWPPDTTHDLDEFGFPYGTQAFVLLSIAIGSVLQVFRYRRSANLESIQQTKWVITGLGMGVIGAVIFLFVIPVINPNVLHPGADRALYVIVGAPLFYLSVMLFPLGLLFSILRFRLWDIDLIVNRTIVYVTLTAILAGVFAALIPFSQRVFVWMTGQESDFAALLTLFIVVALITPVRDRLQTVVDSRFKGTTDAVKMLYEFADQVQARVSQVHPQQIAQRLLDVAVTAYHATGGCALLEGEGPLQIIFTSGDWDGKGKVSAWLEATEGTRALGLLSLGAKSNGTAYTKAETDALQAVAHIIALAITQDKQATLDDDAGPKQNG